MEMAYLGEMGAAVIEDSIEDWCIRSAREVGLPAISRWKFSPSACTKGPTTGLQRSYADHIRPRKTYARRKLGYDPFRDPSPGTGDQVLSSKVT